MSEHLRVVRGDPTAEELAALLAVVSATGAAGLGEPQRVRRGGWSDPVRQLRKPLHPGPNAWRASAH